MDGKTLKLLTKYVGEFRKTKCSFNKRCKCSYVTILYFLWKKTEFFY